MVPPPPLDPEKAGAILGALKELGVNAADVLALKEDLSLLAKTKKKAGVLLPLEADPSGRSVYGEKEFLFPGFTDAFIYKNLKTHGKNYYIRVKEKGKPPFVKSLDTPNREQAVVAGRMLYQEVKGKISRGERSRSINSLQLMQKYLEKQAEHISPLPKEGITKETYGNKCDYLGLWERFIRLKKLDKTKIEQIPTEVGKEFPKWIQTQEKKAHKGKPYSNAYINAVVSEVNYMYHKYALANKYISQQNIPQFERLRVQKRGEHRRDILSVQEWTTLTTFMRSNKYLKSNVISSSGEDTGVEPTLLEIAKRDIFRHYLLIGYSTGARVGELLKMTWGDVYVNPLDNAEAQRENRLMKVRAENSKTGKSREIVAKTARYLERLQEIYEGVEMDCQHQHYLFRNPSSTKKEGNIPYQQPGLSRRLKQVLIQSGVQKKLDATGRNIVLYSQRHFAITMRLMNGVDIYDVALNCGTSVNYIENNYSNVLARMKTDEITKGMSALKTKKQQ
jgi:integrase